ncbi:MAG: hypothetical protein Q9219_003209 [cf. Caloplaca sp. 3 TL-2023]
MTSTGGDSPRPFNASDSQANMDWLNEQHERATTPITVDLHESASPAHDSLEIDTSNANHLGPDSIEPAPGCTTPGQVLVPEQEVTQNSTRDDGQAPLIEDQPPSQVDKETITETAVGDDQTTNNTNHLESNSSEAVQGCTSPNQDLAAPQQITQAGTPFDNQTPSLEGQQPSQIDNGNLEDTAAKDHEATNEAEDLETSSPRNINFGRSILRTPNTRHRSSPAEIAHMKAQMVLMRAEALSRAKLMGSDASLDAAAVMEAEHPALDTNHINENDEGGTSATRIYRNVSDFQEATLFLPQGDDQPRLKRPFAATAETVTDCSDPDVEEIDRNQFANADGKPKRKRRAKLKPPSSEELQQMAQDELAASLEIGTGQLAAKHTKSKTKPKPGAPDRGHGAVKQPRNKKVTVQKVSKPGKPGKKSRMTDQRNEDLLAKLQNHDVIAEANSNLGRTALATSSVKNKDMYLRDLVASVADDDRPGIRGEKTKLLKASKGLGHGVVNPVPGGWTVKGMKSPLLHHQLLGASFMRQRELEGKPPLGGLLADEMGFGKTVMMIATMVTNPPPTVAKAKSTLIVCSPPLLLQWKRELAKHANEGIFRCIITLDAASKQQGDGLASETALENADVVLTTYGQVVKSFPALEPPEELETMEERQLWLERHWANRSGLLHKVNFHRIVLDEAQVIKNHKARTSLACQALRGNYRWAVSGTPILNRVEELFPYFKFLRVKFTGSFDDFKKNFCGKGDSKLYTDRLHACLQQFMLRRTHQDHILGAPIIKLPECHTQTIKLLPTRVEIAMYRAVEARYAQAINAISKWASEEHIHRLTMSMLTRLRQMTAHLFLVQHVLQDMFEMEDIKGLYVVVQGEEASKKAMVAIAALIDYKDEYEEIEDAAPESQEPMEDYPRPSEALRLKFQNHLRTLIDASDLHEFAKRSTCPRCREPPENAYVTSCMHVYCHDCLLAMAEDAAGKNEDGAQCIECDTKYSSTTQCTGIKELNYMNSNLDDSNGTGKAKKRHKPPGDLLKWIRNKEGGVLPSSKSAAIVDQIETWLTDDPDKKIIVFSQWLMMYFYPIYPFCDG